MPWSSKSSLKWCPDQQSGWRRALVWARSFRHLPILPGDADTSTPNFQNSLRLCVTPISPQVQANSAIYGLLRPPWCARRLRTRAQRQRASGSTVIGRPPAPIACARRSRTRAPETRASSKSRLFEPSAENLRPDDRIQISERRCRWHAAGADARGPAPRTCHLDARAACAPRGTGADPDPVDVTRASGAWRRRAAERSVAWSVPAQRGHVQ
jgi:hypothetical protein